ncbi:helix-turn-helix domain-containing protein [Scytonema hofmannii FACHB-248]|uniref:Helix-turn-helix domain-containing protein n=1 Tax=Scytonema hofmannii FACHB-248 TaxID=1842502 RepID=A0ABR8GNG8_9CYAN|nr:MULTISPECIES: RodZ domain-containing protein [Nostocales]MBD2604584.1 helix-turn-helix domain-containing protein [Scytonema hofmannii FACHB-248]
MNWKKSKDDNQPIASVEQLPAEKLASLGGQLWVKRTEQGLSLDEMVALTMIPRRLLQAIEEGNLDDLPEPIYIRGLIRQFADALGLDGAEFAKSFPVGSNRVNLTPGWKPTPFGRVLRPFHLYVLYIGLIICSVNGLSKLLNNAAIEANNSQITEKAQIQPKQTPTVQIQPVSNISSNGQAVQIGVTLKEKSWIRVVADGKTQFEGELPEGTQRTWKAQGQLTVRAGNAGGVLVSVNKEEAKPMGDIGKVKEVIVAAKPGT